MLKKIRIMFYKWAHSKHQHNHYISKEACLISNLIILSAKPGKEFQGYRNVPFIPISLLSVTCHVSFCFDNLNL